jgi:hypothetical protein
LNASSLGAILSATVGGRRRKCTMMRRLFAGVLLAGVTLVAAAAVQAGSPPVTITETQTFTETFQDFVPCREDLGVYTITISAHGLFHVTAAGIDEEGNFVPPYHFKGGATGTVVAVPSDGTGPTFTGRFTDRVGENELITHSTGRSTFSVRATGSDGSRVSFHLVTHYTINANGVEFGFEKPRC